MKERAATDKDKERGTWLTLDNEGNLWTHIYIPHLDMVYSCGYIPGYVCAALDHMYSDWPGMEEPDWGADIIG